MQTIRQKPGVVELPEQTFNGQFSQKIAPRIKNKGLKISDSLSWITCLGIIAILTGLLKYLELGVTMSSVTNAVFFMSIGGIAGFLIHIFYNIRTDRSAKQDADITHLN